ncbi:AraC family transcriptional regulator [Acinetobacter sp. CUI P1]|nr:AraC family transcriptional regulator [Acinetobacter sp. CUI P1]
MIYSFLEETDALGWCIHFFMGKICHATVIGPRSKLHQLQVYQTMLGSRFMELVVYLSRHYDNQEKDIQGNYLMHLANAISFLEDRYLEPFTLEQIAKHSDISVRYLNRIFRAYYQPTPIAYLRRLRLERASAECACGSRTAF